MSRGRDREDHHVHGNLPVSIAGRASGSAWPSCNAALCSPRGHLPRLEPHSSAVPAPARRRASSSPGSYRLQSHVPDLTGARDLADDARQPLADAPPSHRGEECLVGVDAVEEGDDQGVGSEQRGDPAPDGGEVRRLDRDDDRVHRADASGVVGGGGRVCGEIAAGRKDAKSALPDGREMGAAGDQGDFVIPRVRGPSRSSRRRLPRRRWRFSWWCQLEITQ